MLRQWLLLFVFIKRRCCILLGQERSKLFT
jgi:hypothetical protein